MKMLATALALIGLVFAACSEAPSESPGSGEAAAPAPTAEASSAAEAEPVEEPDNLVAATQFSFNTDKIEMTAGEKTELPFVNNDPAPHNISIYVSKGGKQLFEGKPAGDGERVTYQIPPLEKGRYYFMCDMHPPMEGTVVVR